VRVRPDEGKARGAWRSRAALLGAALVLVVAGALGLVLVAGTGAGSGHPAAAAQAREAALSNEAATWVAQQVNRAYTVSCDPAMCQALRARGFANVLVLTGRGQDPLGSEVVVATPAVRRQFGSLLDSRYAPAVIATFGSGSASIDVRTVYAFGTAAYMSALRADLQQRKVAGAELLRFGRITASVSVRNQIAAGQVDSRLVLVLSDLAASYPVDILALGDSGPGASAAVPFRSVTLTISGVTKPRPLLDSLLAAVSPQFRPEQIVTTEQNGHQALVIQFSAPSPLGVFNATNP
jgi:hypothetical protein